MDAGWEFAHVTINEHSRVGFVQLHSDKREDFTSRLATCLFGVLQHPTTPFSLGKQPSHFTH
jgi:hypothetical protein